MLKLSSGTSLANSRTKGLLHSCMFLLTMHPAIALYQRLGFSIRQRLYVSIIHESDPVKLN